MISEQNEPGGWKCSEWGSTVTRDSVSLPVPPTWALRWGGISLKCVRRVRSQKALSRTLDLAVVLYVKDPAIRPENITNSSPLSDIHSISYNKGSDMSCHEELVEPKYICLHKSFWSKTLINVFPQSTVGPMRSESTLFSSLLFLTCLT